MEKVLEDKFGEWQYQHPSPSTATAKLNNEPHDQHLHTLPWISLHQT